MRATASRAGIYGQADGFLPRRAAASAVGGMDYQRPVPGRLSPLDGIVWPSVRAVSSVAFVGPRSGDGAIAGQRMLLRQRMRAALQLLFGPAKTAGG
jgi:hypothetical protein